MGREAASLAGPVITISAPYGAGGSVVAPRLARRCNLPFVDRAVPADLAHDAAMALDKPALGEGLSAEEEASTPSSRILSYFARAAGIGEVMAPEAVVDSDDILRDRSEAELAAVIGGQPGVVLGRAAALVLARRPAAYHVRLDGPPERRLRQAMTIEGVDADTAELRLAETDRARTLFVRRLYRADPADPRLYHLVLDSTVLPLDVAVEVIATAAGSYFASSASGHVPAR